MTNNKYAYSYNREDYTGSYDSPERALNEAVRNAESLSNPPTEIYIGRIVTADPQADDHAAKIIEAMNRRAHVDFGEAAARYLKKVSKKQAQELDAMLEQTILQWLDRNKLMPTFSRITDVREHPIPFSRSTVTTRSADNGSGKEVGELGVSEQPELT
jgi:hypothetical protein